MTPYRLHDGDYAVRDQFGGHGNRPKCASPAPALQSSRGRTLHGPDRPDRLVGRTVLIVVDHNLGVVAKHLPVVLARSMSSPKSRPILSLSASEFLVARFIDRFRQALILLPEVHRRRVGRHRLSALAVEDTPDRVPESFLSWVPKCGPNAGSAAWATPSRVKWYPLRWLRLVGASVASYGASLALSSSKICETSVATVHSGAKTSSPTTCPSSVINRISIVMHVCEPCGRLPVRSSHRDDALGASPLPPRFPYTNITAIYTASEDRAFDRCQHSNATCPATPVHGHRRTRPCLRRRRPW